MIEENKKLWFKAKSYGWGWTPCTWQGWAVLVMYLFAVLNETTSAVIQAPTDVYSFLRFFPNIYILTVFLIIICYATGEKPSWRWGNKQK